MPHSTRWLIDVTAGHTPLQSFYETASTETGAIDKAKAKFRGIGAFGRVSEMGPLRFKATKVKANDRQGRHHATKKAPTAANAGRRDAEIWMQETPESEWADALKPGVLGADEALINALGTAEAAKYLGVSNPYRNGNLTDASSRAFEEYARAWAKRVSEAVRSEKSSTRHHATKKSPAQLDREIAEALARTNPRRHHATRQVGADLWDVAMDAIIEHDPKRAAQIVQAIRAEQGVTVDATPAFSKAVREAPGAVRQAFFEILEGREPKGRLRQDRSDEYSALPRFYELIRRPSDARIWFKATEELKKPGYKGLQVVWYAGDRKPKKAKQSTIHRIDIAQGAYKQMAEADLPPEVHERFYERG